jgi:hypothetical protein
MIHEAFHAKQYEGIISGNMQGASPEFSDYHMNTHIYVMLELYALMKAYSADNESERMLAIQDALSIREERRQRRWAMSPEDIGITIQEGTAQYTDMKLGFSDKVSRVKAFEDQLRWAAENDTIRPRAPYTFGALYGFLLDELGADWRKNVTFHTDLANLLKTAAGIADLKPADRLDLEQYNYSELAANEALRAEKIRVLLRDIRSVFSGNPTLGIAFSLGRSNDITGDYRVINVPGLDESGTVLYGEIFFKDVFGRLTVSDGHFLLSNEFVIPVPGIEIDGNRAFGHGWELELNDGFEIRELQNGNYSVRRS